MTPSPKNLWPWQHLVRDGRLRTAFQGEPGAYSDEATRFVLSTLPVAEAQIDILPHRTLWDVFDALQRGTIDCAVVPIENSQAGSVNDTYDLLIDHHQTLSILAAYDHRVRHCLLALPGQQLSDIERVLSHPQALAQCRAFLHGHGLTPTPEYDTAGSAKMLRDQSLHGCAAIASRRAGALYGLDVLATDIQTNPQNMTRFLVLGAPAATPFRGNDRTSIIFGTDNTPGALYQALGPLYHAQLNLTRLESRPSRDQPWEYVFYVDVDADATQPRVAEALHELTTMTRLTIVLGSYPVLRLSATSAP